MNLEELIYTSLSVAGPETSDVEDILNSSEKNNAEMSITGLLLFDGERYIQILEGGSENIQKLFDAINKDDRHHSLELLHKGRISGRSFETWRMAFETLPKGLLTDLAENMAVYSLGLGDQSPGAGESFGARLNGMFMEAIAAE